MNSGVTEYCKRGVASLFNGKRTLFTGVCRLPSFVGEKPQTQAPVKGVSVLEDGAYGASMVPFLR